MLGAAVVRRPNEVGPRHASSRFAPAALALLLCVTATATLFGELSKTAQPVAVPGPRASAATAIVRLGLMPVSAQALVSSTVGAGSPAFSASRIPGGYALVAGGVRADLGPSSAGMRTDGRALSLQLTAIGHGDASDPVGSAAPRAAANRVLYDLRGVREWYSAGPLGLEQGFTVTRRPAGAGALILALAFRGSLTARRTDSGLIFSRRSRPVLRYGGLTAVDAGGHRLPAQIVLQRHRILVEVTDRAARYPVRIDPFIQQGGKLTPGDASRYSQFGVSVAVSADGNTALIGASRNDNGAGGAWVFSRFGSTWAQQGPKLYPSNAIGASGFGYSVSLSAAGNTALITGWNDDDETGAAWVFTRSGDTWTQGPKLTADDETGGGEFGGSQFGSSSALSGDGDTALIGGQYDNHNAGAAWVFSRSGATWAQEGPKLTGARETGGGQIGESVALSGDGSVALVGGPSDTGGLGAAWVFTREGSGWSEQGPKLVPNAETNAGAFGVSVALSANGSTALVGGPAEFGGAWAFTRSATTWRQQGPELTPSDASGIPGFGSSVALTADGNTALISGRDDNTVGAAWVFARASATWTQQGAKLTGRGTSGQSLFGTSLALSSDGGTAVIGGPNDNDFSGAVWAFSGVLGGPGGVPLCSKVTARAPVGVRQVSIPLSCTAPPGQVATGSIVRKPSHGKLGPVNKADQFVTYTAKRGFTGSDTFTYRATDSRGRSNIATVTVTIPAAPLVEIVRGRIVAYVAPVGADSWRFTEMTVENLAGGSRVGLSRTSPCAPASVARRAPSDGIVNLSSAASGLTLKSGCALVVTLTDAHGRKKVRKFSATRLTVSPTDTCYAGPGSPRRCAEACPPAGRAPAALCNGSTHVADGFIQPKFVSGTGGVELTRLLVAHDADSTLSLYCKSPGNAPAATACPFYAHVVYAKLAGGTDLTPYLKGRFLARGSVVQVWIEHANEIGIVLSISIPLHGSPSMHELCLPQTALMPQACTASEFG